MMSRPDELPDARFLAPPSPFRIVGVTIVAVLMTVGVILAIATYGPNG